MDNLGLIFRLVYFARQGPELSLSTSTYTCIFPTVTHKRGSFSILNLEQKQRENVKDKKSRKIIGHCPFDQNKKVDILKTTIAFVFFYSSNTISGIITPYQYSLRKTA